MFKSITSIVFIWISVTPEECNCGVSFFVGLQYRTACVISCIKRIAMKNLDASAEIGLPKPKTNKTKFSI